MRTHNIYMHKYILKYMYVCVGYAFLIYIHIYREINMLCSCLLIHVITNKYILYSCFTYIEIYAMNQCYPSPIHTHTHTQCKYHGCGECHACCNCSLRFSPDLYIFCFTYICHASVQPSLGVNHALLVVYALLTPALLLLYS